MSAPTPSDCDIGSGSEGESNSGSQRAPEVRLELYPTHQPRKLKTKSEQNLAEAPLNLQEYFGSAPLDKQVRLMSALCHIQAQIMGTVDPHEIFTFLLKEVNQLMDCAFGFIGEIIHGDPGTGVEQDYLRTFAISNIAWNPETNELYNQLHKSGFIFSNLNTLFGHTIVHGETVKSNDPANDPLSRSGGVPKGHPPLESYLGIPFFGHEGLIGMVGIANKPGGFTDEDVQFLKPLALTCGSAVQWLKDRRSRDEANLKLIEEQQKRLDEANAISKAKSLFLSNMSHEIRTPMNGIMGMLELIMRTELSPSQTDYMNTCISSAQSLMRVLDDIIFFSHTDTGQIVLEKKPMSLVSVVEDSIQFVKEAALQHPDLEIAYIVENNVPLNVLGDEARLRQVIINVVGNAVKFTQKGHVTLVVERVTEEEGADGNGTSGCEEGKTALLKFTVSDTGVGLTKEQVDKIFQPFVQVDGSITRSHGGMGLGLAICKKIVGLFNGEISMESRPGRGTDVSFTGTFPLAAEQKPLHRLTSAQLKVLKMTKVICADDNPATLRYLKSLLEGVGCSVEAVSSGAACLEACELAYMRMEPFRIAVVDDAMNDMDGAMVAKALSRSSQRSVKTMPIVLANSKSDYRDYSAYANIHEMIRKPIIARDLIETVSHVVESTMNTFKEQDMKPTRILLAHHSPPQSLVQNLRQAGYRLVVSSGADEAESVFRILNTKFDVVICDIQNTSNEWQGFFQYIHDEAVVPIIVLSGKNIDTMTAEMASSSMCVVGVIKPPHDFNLIQSAVHNVTSGTFKIRKDAYNGSVSSRTSSPAPEHKSGGPTHQVPDQANVRALSSESETSSAGVPENTPAPVPDLRARTLVSAKPRTLMDTPLKAARTFSSDKYAGFPAIKTNRHDKTLGSNVSILIANPNPGSQKLLSMILSKQHHTCETVSNVKQAKEKVVAKRPDVVLLDDALFDADEGEEFVKWLGTLRLGNDGVAVILVSNDSLVRERAEACSVSTVVEKPVSSAAISAAVIHALSCARESTEIVK